MAVGDGVVFIGLWIIAAVRCAPPCNQPTPTERATCSSWLQRDLELATPHVRAVLCLGAIGWDAALVATRAIGWTVPNPKPRFGHAAEAELRTADGRPVRFVGSYHVSPHNTNTGRLTPDMFDEVLRTLHRGPGASGSPPAPGPDRSLPSM